MAVKFPLKMADDTMVRTLEDLREHFDLTTVLSYYDNGRLVKWLENGLYDDEAAKVAALDTAYEDFAKNLCAILGVNHPADDHIAVDLGSISHRNKRIEQLRQYTVDDTILSAVDRVVFTQEELADLLQKGITDVYLCGEQFSIPEGFENISYQCINNPVVKFSKVERLETAIGQGDVKALSELGHYYEEKCKIDAAVTCYMKAIDQGDNGAHILLRNLYLDKRYELDEDVLRQMPIEQQVRIFEAKYGTILLVLEENLLNAKDEVAKRWEKALQSDLEAQGMSGLDVDVVLLLLNSRWDVQEEDIKKALQGDPDAQCQLGMFFEVGIMLNANPKQAVKWYRKAAEQDNLYSKQRLEQLLGQM